MSGGLTPGRGIGLAGLLVTTALLAPGVASAATVTPNTTADEYSATNDGVCSLREAIQSVDGDSNFGGCTATNLPYHFTTPADTVQLPAGHYTLTIPPTGGDDNASGDLNTTHDTTIQADSGAQVTIDGNGIDRVLFASTFGVTVTINGVTITGGSTSVPGSMSAANGGGIVTSGGTNLVVTNSTISNNTVDGFGAGLDVNGPTTLTNDTISGNTSTELGGAGLASTGASIALDNVTISDNHYTNTSAAASQVAGGFLTSSATATLHNSLIAGNTSAAPTTPAPDCQANPAITSQGGNVIGSDTGCTYTAAGSDSVNNANAASELTPLGLHGGPTPTQALLPGVANPAIDRGVATCQTLDQRGKIRSGRGTSCDSGAFELGPDTTLTIMPPIGGSVTGTGINCPGDCSEIFHDGTNVPLSTTPASGFLFDSWTGDCSGSGACAAIMDANRTVGATFDAIPSPPTGTTPPPARKKKCKHKRRHHAVAAKKCKKKSR